MASTGTEKRLAALAAGAARPEDAFQQLLLRLSAVAAEGGDFTSLVQLLCAYTRQFFQVHGAYYWKLQPDGSLQGVAAEGHMAARFVGSHLRLSDASVVTRAVQERKAVYVNDPDAALYPMAAEYNSRAVMAAPLIVSGEAIGAFVLIHTADPTFFNEDLAAKATILGAVMATLVEASRMAQASQEERRRSQVLVRCTRALHSSLDRQQVLHALAEGSLELFQGRLATAAVVQEGRVASLEVAGGPAELVQAVRGDIPAWLRDGLIAVAESEGPQWSALRGPYQHLAQFTGSSEAISAPLASGEIRGAVIVCAGEKTFGIPETALLGVLGDFGAMALANSELYARASAQSRELQQLLQISAELSGTSELERFLQQFVVRGAEFLNFKRSFIALCEGDGCYVRWAAADGEARRQERKLTGRITDRVLLQKKPYWTDNPAAEPDMDIAAVHELDVRQYLAVPLLGSNGEALGLFGVLDKRVGSPISAEDVRRAQALAAEVAVVLESTRNLHLSEEHRRRAENLMSLALELNSSLRLPDFVRSFTLRAADMLGARAAALALAQRAALETVFFHDEAHPADKQVTRRLNLALSELAANRSEELIHGMADEIFGPGLAEALGWMDVTLARLTGADHELIGMLCLVDRGKSPTATDRNLLQALGGHASVAMENARLFSRIAQSNKQWAEIFDAITDYIVVHDEGHKVLRVNRSLADFIGVRPNELIGVGMRALIAMAIEPGAQPCPFCRAGQDEDDEYIHHVLDRTYLVSTSRIHGPLHEGRQTIHVLKDISDRREAERRYRELFDNIQEGLFFSVPDGRFIEVNDALVRMLGYDSREELLQTDPNTQIYVSPEESAKLRQALDAQGVVRNYELAMRRKDGTLVHTLQNTFAVRDPQGKPAQYRGLMLDITELKNFQSQLQRERDFNLKILNNTLSMILVVDTAGLITYANRRCFEAGGYTEAQLLGRRLAELVAPSRRQVFEQAFSAAVGGHQGDNLELQLVRGSGGHGHFSVNLSPMRDEQGAVTSIVIVMTDITDAAILQAKLMHTEKMAAVGQLVSGVAHEVNNPLTAILGFSDLLLEKPDVPESAKRDLRIVVQEAHRTKTIVQNLLSFARQVPPRREPVHLNPLLRRTIQLRSYDLANHGVQVREQFTEPLASVMGDSHQLQQVFLNILNNAYDAVRESGRQGLIDVRTAPTESHVEVVFCDNGNGIAQPERIFDPFFTTKEVGKGTGLGLSICYGIVREHGGEILAANNPGGKGATFTVRLPLAARRSPGEAGP